MKRFLSACSILALSAGMAFAGNPFDKFADQVGGVAQAAAQRNLDNLAKDLGPVMGGGQYFQAKTLGFPGFSLGIEAPARSVNKDNAIVKAAGVDTLLLPAVQAGIGLPFKIDLLGRMSQYQDSSLTGVGLRYGLLRSIVPGLPSVSVQAMYNSLKVSAGSNKLSASNINVAAVASVNLAFLTPYAGASYISTTVEPDSAISTLKGTASGVMFEGGLTIRPLPLTYLRLGASLYDGDIGYSAGMGLSF